MSFSFFLCLCLCFSTDSVFSLSFFSLNLSSFIEFFGDFLIFSFDSLNSDLNFSGFSGTFSFSTIGCGGGNGGGMESSFLVSCSLCLSFLSFSSLFFLSFFLSFFSFLLTSLEDDFILSLSLASSWLDFFGSSLGNFAGGGVAAGDGGLFKDLSAFLSFSLLLSLSLSFSLLELLFKVSFLLVSLSFSLCGLCFDRDFDGIWKYSIIQHYIS